MSYEFLRLFLAILDTTTGVDARLALHALFRRHVDRASCRYPDAYFELCRRDEEALLSLTHRLLTECEFHERGRAPFRGRTPFDAYRGDRSPDSDVRFHTFYGHFSLLREQLKQDYADNLRNEPSVRHLAEAWSELGAALRRVATPRTTPHGRYPIWTLLPHPQTTRDLDARVIAALGAAGGESTQARLAASLRTSALRPIPPEPARAPPLESTMDEETVRTVVRTVWEKLPPNDQDLLEAVALGNGLEPLLERCPVLRNPANVTKAITAIDKVFLETLSATLERPARWERSELRPSALAELLYAAIFDLLRRAGHRKRRDERRARPATFPGTPSAVEDCEAWDAAIALGDALHHPTLAQSAGLEDSWLADIGAAAWEADPARALAEAEFDAGLWIEEDPRDA